MKKIIRNSLSWIVMLVLTGCFGPGQGIINSPALRPTVQTQNGATTFSQAGEIINYSYNVSNGGSTPLGGPVTVTEGTKQVSCSPLNTVGNKDNYLDLNETANCPSTYTISQADVTAGSVTITATASAGGQTSVPVSLKLTLGTAPPSTVLKLTKTSSSQTYGKAGEIITYTYTITNTGATPLGPDQFKVTDNKLAGPINCGEANTTLPPNQGASVSCQGTYTITPADANLANVTNSATATGAGQTSAAVSVTIANLAPPVTPIPPTTPPQGNYQPGSTVQHRVAKGEWLIQIVRCWGATYSEVIAANPQIRDPSFILPADFPNGTIVTVPRIGSAGKIYGPPCVAYYTVQSGDTWASIAQRNNADIVVLQKVNPVALTAGTLIKIPLNSAGGTAVYVTSVPANTTAVPPPQATQTALIRLTIDPGQVTTARVGVINPNETIHYAIAATQGQTLSLKLTAPPNEVAIGVNSPTGVALKTLDASPSWSTVVTATGDYFINIMSLTGGSSKSYTLEVSLTGASPTATNTPGS